MEIEGDCAKDFVSTINELMLKKVEEKENIIFLGLIRSSIQLCFYLFIYLLRRRSNNALLIRSSVHLCFYLPFYLFRST